MVTLTGPVSFQHCTVALSPDPSGLPACTLACIRALENESHHAAAAAAAQSC